MTCIELIYQNRYFYIINMPHPSSPFSFSCFCFCFYSGLWLLYNKQFEFEFSLSLSLSLIGQNINLHASQTAQTTAFLKSDFLGHLISFCLVLWKHTALCILSCQSYLRPQSTMRFSRTIRSVATGTQWSGPMKWRIVYEFLPSRRAESVSGSGSLTLFWCRTCILPVEPSYLTARYEASKNY